MNIKIFGEIISEFIPLVLIVDRDGLIIWMSKDSKRQFSVDLKGIRFDEKFSVTVDLIKKNREITIEHSGNNYMLKARGIDIEDNEYTVVLFEDWSSFDNKDTKIYALESIIANISDGIIASDFDGKIVVYNNAMEKLEDKRAKDMVGSYLWDAYGYEQKDDSEHRIVFNNGKAILNRYAAHAYNNGVPKYVSYSTYPISRNGERIGVYTISKNETKLHSLLSETVELKRKFNKEDKNDTVASYKSNGTIYTFSDLIGTSEHMIKLIKEAQAIAWVDNNVLLVGETGTGKEVFAQCIHNFGKRKDQPFIGINCSAIPENLLESILFGTVKGSFTGALDHSGLFEEAKEGTLFLDELNSMPITMQTKLLRVLQEKRVRPVGGNTTNPINCRIISAMNEEPHGLIKKGKLREDLFYRIAGFNLYIPPLRERKKDIFDISDAYISGLNKTMHRNILGLSRELRNIMANYGWPGNVRELQHFIENLMVRVDIEERYLRISDMPDYIKERVISSNAIEIMKEDSESLPATLNSLEKKIILEALEKNRWNISKTSRELGIIRQSLLYRIKKLGIERNNGV